MSPPPAKAVVIIDDEKSYGDLLSQLLIDNLDCPVLTFSNPQEALDALPNLNVGVVVTDFFMPDLNGVQFIRRAAPDLPGVAFIMITGHPLKLSDEPFDDIPALKAVVSKPFKWSKLCELVREHWPEADPRRLGSV